MIHKDTIYIIASIKDAINPSLPSTRELLAFDRSLNLKNRKLLETSELSPLHSAGDNDNVWLAGHKSDRISISITTLAPTLAFDAVETVNMPSDLVAFSVQLNGNIFSIHSKTKQHFNDITYFYEHAHGNKIAEFQIDNAMISPDSIHPNDERFMDFHYYVLTVSGDFLGVFQQVDHRKNWDLMATKGRP